MKDKVAIEMKKNSLIHIVSYLISLTLSLSGCESNTAGFLATNNSEEVIDSSQQKNFTCVTAIQYELVPKNVDGPDAFTVCLSTSDRELIKVLERESLMMYVWKDTTTTLEDSAVFSFRGVKIRRVSEGSYELGHATTDLRDYSTDELYIPDLELSRNPQVKIVSEDKQWVVRSCHLKLMKM